MGARQLAEAIMLQSVEDLWDEQNRDESISFFKGSQFELCAEAAGMALVEQVRLMLLVKKAVDLVEMKKTPTPQRKRVFRTQKSAVC